MRDRGRRTVRRSFEFERAYREGRSYRGRLLAVHVFPNGLSCSRLGLSVSRKVGGSAVKRNEVKRRLREVFRQEAPEQSGLDFVISARHGAAEASLEELRADFVAAVSKLGFRENGGQG